MYIVTGFYLLIGIVFVCALLEAAPGGSRSNFQFRYWTWKDYLTFTAIGLFWLPLSIYLVFMKIFED